jgi:hypothetical protein
MDEQVVRRAGTAAPAWRGVSRRRTGQLILVAAGLLIATVAAAAFVRAQQTTRPHAALAAPALQAGAVTCRQDPMAHVHDPTSLVVVARCSTVSGTVRHVHYEPRYGNQHLLVAPDPAYQRFLLPENHGLITVEVIPTDETTVRIPRAGQHASFHGAFVFNKNQQAVELHPTWRIDVPGAGSPGAPRTGPSPTFTVTAHAPQAVVMGGQVAVSVRTERVWQGRRRPAAGAHVFLELVAPSGKGVQWAAASTNPLGDATIHLVALRAPARFTLTLYSNDLQFGRQVITRLPLEVRRP